MIGHWIIHPSVKVQGQSTVCSDKAIHSDKLYSDTLIERYSKLLTWVSLMIAQNIDILVDFYLQQRI